METTEFVRCLLFLHKALLELTIPISDSIVLQCHRVRTSDAQIRVFSFFSLLSVHACIVYAVLYTSSVSSYNTIEF